MRLDFRIGQSFPRIALWVIWVGFVLFVATVWAISNFVVMPSFERIQDQITEQNVYRAQQLLNKRLETLSHATTDYASWDDSYAYIQKPGQEYERSNFTFSVFANLELSFLAYVDLSGKVIYSASLDYDQQRLVPLRISLTEFLNPRGLLRQGKGGVSGIFKTQGQLYLVSSQPILTSGGLGPARGNIIMGRLINQALTQEISAFLKLPTKIQTNPSQTSDYQEVHLDSKTAIGSVLLRDLNDRPVAALEVSQPRDTSSQGQKTMNYVVAFFVLLGLITVLLARMLLGWFFQSQKQRLNLEQRYRAVVEQASEGMMLVDPNTLEILESNASLRRILAYDKTLPQKLGDLVALENSELSAWVAQTLERGQVQWGEQKACDSEGGLLDVEISSSQIRHAEGAFILVVLKDIRGRKLQQAQITQMAYHDSLTGLANRRQLHERTEQTLAIAEREGWPLALLYLDLDRFKNVNDSMGHDAGDELLVMVADFLRTCVRQGDTLARLGGDEFAILLYQATPKEAQNVAERVVELLASPMQLRGHRVQLGVSVGIACYPEHGGNLLELLKAADIAMYQAKHGGGGWAFFDLQRNPYNAERMGLENALHQAIHSREIQLHYQPVLNLKTRRIEGCEGLARWYKNEIWIPPWSFIQVAEDSNLIFDLDMLVLETGLEQLKALRARNSKAHISLNLSTLSLGHKELAVQVAGLLKLWQIPASSLTLEITETAAMENPQATFKILNELKELGVRIALDDFGSGYASLAYLRYLPIDQLKIDRSLVQHVGSGGLDEKLVLAAIMMGKSLGLEVVAEGVESQLQLDWLTAQGCDYAQGFVIGHPVEFDQIMDQLNPKDKAIS